MLLTERRERYVSTPTVWQKWRDHPEKVWVRQALFQIHFWAGAIAGVYVFVMSVSGSAIVYRNQFSDAGISVEPLVSLHSNLLAGAAGRSVNGIGAACLVTLCITGAVIWWPGIGHWRRSLTVAWRASFPRMNWDLHSAVGFWTLPWVFLWGVSGLYLVFPDQFAAALRVDPGGSFAAWMADLHFGRFNAVTRAIWALVGLVPAVLAFTGVFICCRRVIFQKPSNPKVFIP